jgi:hypothetical protein
MPDLPLAATDNSTEKSDAALAYDAWFRSEVEEAIREVDAPNAVWVSNEEVEREALEQEDRWLDQIEKKRKSA